MAAAAAVAGHFVAVSELSSEGASAPGLTRHDGLVVPIDRASGGTDMMVPTVKSIVDRALRFIF